MKNLGYAIWLEASYRLSRTGMSRMGFYRWYVVERKLKMDWWK